MRTLFPFFKALFSLLSSKICTRCGLDTYIVTKHTGARSPTLIAPLRGRITQRRCRFPFRPLHVFPNHRAYTKYRHSASLPAPSSARPRPCAYDYHQKDTVVLAARADRFCMGECVQRRTRGSFLTVYSLVFLLGVKKRYKDMWRLFQSIPKKKS